MLVAGLVGVAALGSGLVAGPAQAVSNDAGVTVRALPPGSVRHGENQYWTWFGPQNWTAAYGAYGITIFGTNKRTLDYGFSSTVCANGATMNASVKNYFAAKRAQLRQSGVKKLKLKVGAIKQLPPASFGPNYFRQIVEFSGRSGRTNIRGEVYYDYGINNSLYCFSRSQSRTAPAAGYNKSIRQLRSVQSNLAYYGPGA